MNWLLKGAAVVGFLALPSLAAAQTTGLEQPQSASAAVQTLDNGGMLIIQRDYKANFGKSTLTASQAASFSPSGKLWAPDQLDNVVLQGGGLAAPVFMSRASLQATDDGSSALVSDGLTTMGLGGGSAVVVHYSCAGGTIHANGHDTGNSDMCLGSDTVAKCTADGEHVMVIHTQAACKSN